MKSILLNTGEVTLVNDIDFEFLLSFNSWYMLKKGKTEYAQTKIKCKTTLMHRLIVERVLGYFKGEVDHEDGNGLNNQRSNSDEVQNSANRGPPDNNTSGYKGVHWVNKMKKWQARIQISGTRFSLGHFNDPIEAAKAYDCAAKSTWKEFAWLNFT